MAEGLPTGIATPDTAQNQQETRAERRQRRRDIAREVTNRENTVNPETRAQTAALQQTNTEEVGSGLLARVANFPIDVAKAGGRVAWKATKGTAKFGGRVAVGTVKYPAMFTGGTILAGGLGVAGALGGTYMLGKTLWQHGSTTYKSKNFYDSMVNNFKLGKGHFVPDKKK